MPRVVRTAAQLAAGRRARVGAHAAGHEDPLGPVPLRHLRSGEVGLRARMQRHHTRLRPQHTHYVLAVEQALDETEILQRRRPRLQLARLAREGVHHGVEGGPARQVAADHTTVREAVGEQHTYHAVAARHVGDGVRRPPPPGAAADERLGDSVRLHRLEQLLDPHRRGARGSTGGKRGNELRVARHAPPPYPGPDAQLQRGRERVDKHVLL
eukprot:scaffold36097_cov73-Phaeocystis_antarctica.AAC.4